MEQVTSGTVVHVALVGRPNVGKSTIFNALTGLTQHTGNWPGKTVELAEGWVNESGGLTLRLVDLPGTYSIASGASADEDQSSPLGVDEAVARDYVLEQRPDLLIAVVNAAALEQDLFLVGQLESLPVPKLVVLNMVDILERQEGRLDLQLLQRRLGMPVIAVSAHRRGDLAGLKAAIVRALGNVCGQDPQAVVPAAGTIPGRIAPPLPTDALGMHGWTAEILKGVIQDSKRSRQLASDIADRYLTHPVVGLLALLGVLGATFAITFGLGTPLQSLLEDYVMLPLDTWMATLLRGAPTWVSRLVTDGLLGGAGTVVTFVPILALFFAALAILEDSGYLARAAVVMDKFMHVIGLHGKSFLPLFLGFGCNVPAVMGARTIESPRGRIMVSVLASLVPCAARMAVLNFVAAAFFGARAAIVVWAMVVVNMFTLTILGVVLSRTVLRDPDSEELLMELPAYHVPDLRTTGYLVWFKLKSFLSKAGTVIVAASAVLWAAGYFPNGAIETSYLARLGQVLEPFGMLAGLDWRLLLAVLAGFVAKENALAALGILYGGGELGLAEALTAAVSVPSALSFIVMLMLFIPCVATVAVIRQELKSNGWTAFVLGVLFVVSFGAAALTYRIASTVLG